MDAWPLDGQSAGSETAGVVPTRRRSDRIRRVAGPYLAQLGIPPDFDREAHGDMGKIVLRLRDGSGYVKLAIGSGPSFFLLAEARGYAAAPNTPRYQRPSFRLLREGEDWSAAILQDLPARPFRRRAALVPRRGPFEGIGASPLPVGELLRDAVPGRVSGRLRDRLVARWGERRFSCAPSHGDFIYWNLGRLPDGKTALFDLEYYAPARSRHFDRFFWSIVPLVRQAVRRFWLAPILLQAAPVIAAMLSPDGADGLALMLAEHASLLDAEHAVPETRALLDEPTFTLRQGLVTFYERLVERLLGS